jgi:hypothetical protein
MRAATLSLGFLGFDAESATTGAWHDNGPSLGVTRSLGYAENGSKRSLRNDEYPDRLLLFEMSRDHFVGHVQRDDIEIVGVEPVRAQLGLG